MAVWSQIKVRGRPVLQPYVEAYSILQPRLYVRSVCNTKVPLQLQLRLVALYKCYTFAFASVHCVASRPSAITVSS